MSLQSLNGYWEGASTRSSDKGGDVTHWRDCQLEFHPQDGKIIGTGQSVWKGNQVPFKLRGCFDRALRTVDLIKIHEGLYSCATHYVLRLDVNARSLEGSYAHGTLVLQHRSMITSAGGAEETLVDRRAKVGGEGEDERGGDALESFLRGVLGPTEGARYHKLLTENEVDWEALPLMTEQHLKELGIPLGPRVKILRALQHDAGTNAVSPPPSLSPSPPPAFAPAPTPAPAPSASRPPGPSASEVPRDFLCPITCEIMQDPVVLSDGFTYEREAISRWLSQNNKSPMTGRFLTSRELRPNQALKSIIQTWTSGPARALSPQLRAAPGAS